MIIRSKQLILLDQTIAYKNANLEFIDFTDNLLAAAGSQSEDAILGKRDDEDLPWSAFADEYHMHDKDALEGNSYSAIVPFSGAKGGGPVLCNRSKCKLEDGTTGIHIHVIPLNNPSIYELVTLLRKTEPVSLHNNYYIGKEPNNIKLTNKESECLFYLIRGKPSKVIAKIMNISCRTVEFHIENLKVKFKCHCRNELISIAIQEGYMSIIPKGIPVKSINEGLRV